MPAKSCAEPVQSNPKSVEVNAALSPITIALPTRRPIISSLIAAQRMLSCLDRIWTLNFCSPSGVLASIRVNIWAHSNLSSTIILRDTPSFIFSLFRGFSGEIGLPQFASRKRAPFSKVNLTKLCVYRRFNFLAICPLIP